MSGTDVNQDSSAVRKPYARVITDKRREQNRRSQKAYRERLRKRFESLEELEERVKTKEPQDKATTLDVPFQEPRIQSDERDYSLQEPELDELDYPLLESQDELGFSSVIDLAQAFAAGGDLALPKDCTLPAVNIAIRPRTPIQKAGGPPSPTSSLWHIWPSPSRSPLSEYAPPDKFMPVDLSTPSSPTPTSVSSWPGFSLTANFLRLQGENSFAASLSIGLSIGITQESYIEDHPSPFYLSNSCYTSNFFASGTPDGIVPPVEYLSASRESQAKWSFVKPDLRPSSTQLTQPHPSYIDCIIYPSFRDRAIELSVSGKLDHYELFMDLIRDGLVCWGGANKAGMGNGVAWTTRSWEARPWFLRKWWFLAGGEEEEVWQGSRWWWSMRGEDVDINDVLFNECESR